MQRNVTMKLIMTAEMMQRGAVADTAAVGQFAIGNPVEETLAKIHDLCDLDYNWDSYGALKPTRQAFLGAGSWINELLLEDTPVPDVFPTSDGNFQLEWSMCGFEIELKIYSYSRIAAYVQDLEKGVEWERDFNIDIAELAKVINELTQRHKRSQLRLVG
jgi:hypothetical protein